MDSITQAALGATIAVAGWRSSLGSRAIWFGVFCGMAPDFDIAASLAGEWESLYHHRGVSHSLVVLPFVAPIFGWLGYRFGRTGELSQWIHLAFWALITHPLLDLFTSYGTQLLAPISDRRFSVDGVAILDPIYTAPMLVVLVFGLRKLWAWLALGWGAFYLLLGTLGSQLLEHRVEGELHSQGFEAVSVRAPPQLGAPLLRRVVARDAQGEMRVGFASVLRVEGFDLIALSPPRGEPLDGVLDHEHGQLWAWFSDGFLTARLSDDGRKVELHDQRYGMANTPTRSLFVAQAELDEEGRVVEIHRSRRTGDSDMEQEMRQRWKISLEF